MIYEKGITELGLFNQCSTPPPSSLPPPSSPSSSLSSPKVDIEVDAVIEGSLAAEASLVVLDTLELLIQTVSMVENLQSMLGKVSDWRGGIR